MEKRIIRLIHDCWTTCNRVGMYYECNLSDLRVLQENARVSEKNITDDLVTELPPMLIKLINRNFNNLSEVLHFFSEVNKNDNYNKFKDMLDSLGSFKGSDFLIDGSVVAKRPFNYSAVKVTTTEYVS